MNVQTIASVDLKVMNIVSRWPGSTHDQTIFINSLIKRRFERGDFEDFILIGDSGYANTWYLATPFTVNNNEDRNHQREAYNRSIISTRNVVERSYGVIKRRFPVLAYGMRVKLSTAQRIIVACAVLHNIAIDAREPMPPRGENENEDRIEILIRDGDVPIAAEEIQPQRVVGRRRMNARDEILRQFRV